MMKTLVAALTAAATAVLIGGFTPAAHACPPDECDSTPLPPTPQETQFIADMKNAGVTSPYGDSHILSAGYTLCIAQRQYMDAGMGFPASFMDIIKGSIRYRDGNQIMAIALQDLCPTNSGWGGRPGVGGP